MTINEDALNAGLTAGRRAYRRLYQTAHDPHVVRMVDNAVEDALEAAAPHLEGAISQKTVQLISDLASGNDCEFDHKGGCQAHGYLTLRPGELCPHQEAKTWLQEQGSSEEDQAPTPSMPGGWRVEAINGNNDRVMITSPTGIITTIHREDADPEHRFLNHRLAAGWFGNLPAGHQTD